ncbi:hypothetical protein N0V90_003786 [Kalmusia sp. IMI 367209]|nr:hypothetical protein N0V90_003786 [Kalmusia sp. IMI 367209]
MNSYTTTFTQNTKDTFALYLQRNPNKRRISLVEKENIVEWLSSPHKHPSTQEEFSRRHYVRKTFSWDKNTNTLFANAKKGAEEKRVVVTEDSIIDVIELVHNSNGHAGWDATWKDINTSYYGILRIDVTTLLKECQVCLHNPRKRPKGSATVLPNVQLVGEDSLFDLTETSRWADEPEYLYIPEA